MISTVAALAISSIGATYAWYQYQTFVSVGAGGTSIDVTKIFEVGLVSEVALDTKEHNWEEEIIGEKRIYWINGAATADLTNYYLSMNGYGTTKLEGVTSGKYQPGILTNKGLDLFELKRAPSSSSNYYHPSTGYYNAAETKNYLHFQLVFRLSVLTSEGQSSYDSSSVILTNVDFENYNNDLHNAVRIHFCDANDGAKGFVFNPTSNDDGYDSVGAPLDLTDDGVFDTYTKGTDTYEFPYGEFDTLVYKDEKTTDGVYHGSGDDDGNSFTAEHLNGVYAIDMDKSEASKSYYSGTNSVIRDGKVLASPDSHGLAYLNMDIYLEGWDNAFTNKNMDQMFECNLEFESL